MDFFFKILLKFVPGGIIDHKSALVVIMSWRWKGNKPSYDSIEIVT